MKNSAPEYMQLLEFDSRQSGKKILSKKIHRGFSIAVFDGNQNYDRSNKFTIQKSISTQFSNLNSQITTIFVGFQSHLQLFFEIYQMCMFRIANATWEILFSSSMNIRMFDIVLDDSNLRFLQHTGEMAIATPTGLHSSELLKGWIVGIYY